MFACLSATSKADKRINAAGRGDERIKQEDERINDAG
jgi:hypothetical protein